MKSHSPLQLVILGCGSRSCIYAALAASWPERYEIVAVADPIQERRAGLLREAGCIGAAEYSSAEALLDSGQLGDVAIIGTQDQFHRDHAIAAMQAGYDLLLEKPIATTLADILEVRDTSIALSKRVVVCHVLRYAPLFRKIKEIVDSGRVGQIVSIHSTEGVGGFHFAHSFVRGHWSIEEESSPMILAKACHDMDILAWIIRKPCVAISSRAELSHFRQKCAPPGAARECSEQCRVFHTCPYSSRRYFSDMKSFLSFVAPDLGSCRDDDDLALKTWLKESPWNRCVYSCNNNAPDHQTVSMLFDGQITASFTMTAFAEGRSIEIFGQEGVLRAGDSYASECGADILIRDHSTSQIEKIKVDIPEGKYRNHGGGDSLLMNNLFAELSGHHEAAMTSSISDSVQSHIMALAADHSRRNHSAEVIIADFVRGSTAHNASLGKHSEQFTPASALL